MPEEVEDLEIETTETTDQVVQEEPKYQVTVGDDTVEVTLEELQSGFMRQSDYTRKTQDLANQRKELETARQIQQAFEQDPEAATMALAEFYGFTPTGGTNPEPQTDEWGSPVEPQGPSPEQQKIAELERQVRALATNQSVQHLDREAQALAERYPGIDPEEVKRHAVQNKLPSLEVAARDLLFDDRNEAWQTLQERKRSEQEVVESKRNAGVVSPGSSPASGSVNAPGKDYTKMSFSEIFAETAKEANVDLSDGLLFQ